MQTRVNQNAPAETVASASAGRFATGSAPQQQNLAGLLLRLQRTRGNRFVQQVLAESQKPQRCECGGTCDGCRSEATDHRLRHAEDLSQRESNPGLTTSISEAPPTFSPDDTLIAAGPTSDFPALAPDLRRGENMGEVRCSLAKGELEQLVNRDHCAGDCVARHEQTHKSDPNLAKACDRVSKCMTNPNADWSWVPQEYQRLAQTEDWIYQGFCRDSYDGWHSAYSDWTECQAYTGEKACLEDVIHHSCGGRKSDLQSGFGIGGGVLGAVGGALGGFFLAGALNITTDLGIGAMTATGAAIGGGLGSLAGVGIGTAIAGPVDEGCCSQLRGENGLQAVNESIAKHCPNAGQSHASPIPFGEDGSIIDRRYLPGELANKQPAPTG